MQAWMISKKDLEEILETAKREAREKHPKQPRRRFDAWNEAIRHAVNERGELCEFESFAQLTEVAGIVSRSKVNLGTKTWPDYRTNYTAIYGKIERETEKSVMICSTWIRKRNLFAVIRDWDFSGGRLWNFCLGSGLE